MFQYAMARSIQRKYSHLVLLYHRDYYKDYSLFYFQLDKRSRFLLSNKIIRDIYDYICRALIKILHYSIVCDSDRFPMVDVSDNHIHCIGYFQGEYYFEGICEDLKALFTIKPNFQEQYINKYSYLLSNDRFIVIHIRRTDYIDMGWDIPKEYYQYALSKIENIEQYDIYFIGDDMESVNRDFSSVPNAHFERNSSIVDFQLIQHAPIAIISNSSFAWWAAYLSHKEKPRIIAPKYWLGYNERQTKPFFIETKKFEWIDWSKK